MRCPQASAALAGLLAGGRAVVAGTSDPDVAILAQLGPHHYRPAGPVRQWDSSCVPLCIGVLLFWADVIGFCDCSQLCGDGRGPASGTWTPLLSPALL
ncbi:hypothetical protein NDU88_000634 [Pleurodeles waltl]|uniref:Uncharacterized protein n=1 Tax=Pleurodeles waltl TaxID=8319 RepID=A0AAV7VWN3_PLEWA|nr:hypothetical protein NDU88_000634 [Pleurodeles waltl]